LNLKIIAPVIGIALVVLAVSFQVTSTPETVANPIKPVAIDFESTELVIMETNGVKHLIPLDKIKGGGPPKDGIPSIDNPVFADIQGSQFMSDSDTVIGLEINGEAKAYPLSILVWHEIVNDNVGGTTVAVTYCPLCYTKILVFHLRQLVVLLPFVQDNAAELIPSQSSLWEIQITFVRFVLIIFLVVGFLVLDFLVVDFFTAFLLEDFLVLDTGNTIEKLIPHLNEE